LRRGCRLGWLFNRFLAASRHPINSNPTASASPGAVP
jgi:hypothetical protein